MIQKLLLEAELKHETIAFYTNRQNTEKFLVGQVMRSGEDIVLQLISPDNEFDGVCFCPQRSIFRIEVDTQYLKNMPQYHPRSVNTVFGENIWDDYLRYVESARVNVDIRYADDVKISGAVVSHSENDVIIMRENAPHNQCTIRRDEIILIATDSKHPSENREEGEQTYGRT